MRASFRVLMLWGCFLFSGFEAQAARYYFDATGSVGNSAITVSEDAEAPTLLQYSVGLTFAYLFDGGLFVGGTSDMRYINQYSSPTANVGNHQGTRLNTISPTIGFRSGSLLVKADYQIMGDYRLTAMTKGQASDLKYSSPRGKRLNILFPISTNFWMGLVAESVEYGKSNVMVDAESNEEMTSTQIGLVMTRTFGAK